MLDLAGQLGAASLCVQSPTGIASLAVAQVLQLWCSQLTGAASRTVVQVLQLKISCLKLPSMYGSVTAEEVQAHVRRVRHAAELLAAVPSLIIGEPGSGRALNRSLCVWRWPSDEQLNG